MSETLEQISKRILNEVSQDGWLCGYDAVEEFARRLVAALGAQEPAGHYCVSYFRGCAGMANTEFHPSIDFAEGTHALYAAPVVNPPQKPVAEVTDANQPLIGTSVIDAFMPIGTKLYTAPAVNPDWQMVPKEPTPEMIDQGARGLQDDFV